MASHDRPDYTDVRWDHGAARAAIVGLRRAADEVERARLVDVRVQGPDGQWRTRRECLEPTAA